MKIARFGKWHYFFLLATLTSFMVWVRNLPQLDFIAWLQTQGNPTITGILQFISDSITFISFGIPITLAIIGERKENKKKSRLTFLYVALSIALAGLVSYTIKKMTSIPRPYEIDERIAQWSVGGGFSFPSGHTTEAFASAISLIFLFRSWKMAIPVLVWASSVAFSRIYLGVHYPFDILGGITIGLTVAYGLHLIFKNKTEIFRD
jgi:membrane-associated phospholipid phosphatase